MVARDGLAAGVGAAAGMAATAAAVQHATVPPVGAPAGGLEPRSGWWSRCWRARRARRVGGGRGAGRRAAAGRRRVLLVDAADPARSGLADAAPAEGLRGPPTSTGCSCATRGATPRCWRGWNRRYPIVPAMVPPAAGVAARRGPVHVTVVDVGHDGWRAAADPLLGAGGWLRRGHRRRCRCWWCAPPGPSLRGAEQVLARLHRWVTAGVAEPPAQLVVVGARRWPRGVTGAAGRLLEPLLDDAVFLPRHPDVETGGVTADLLPRPLLGRSRRCCRTGSCSTTRRRDDSSDDSRRATLMLEHLIVLTQDC